MLQKRGTVRALVEESFRSDSFCLPASKRDEYGCGQEQPRGSVVCGVVVCDDDEPGAKMKTMREEGKIAGFRLLETVNERRGENNAAASQLLLLDYALGTDVIVLLIGSSCPLLKTSLL